MLCDILRFNREAPAKTLLGGNAGEMTVGEFLATGGYSREFAEHYLLPMGSAIWSSPIGRFREFPVRFVVEFFKNHGLLDLRDRPTWRVVEGGARTYVSAMIARFRGRVSQLNADCARRARTGGCAGDAAGWRGGSRSSM